MLNGLRPRSYRRVRRLLHVMAADSPLSAQLAEEAGFDGIWASGFELSALFGMPDLSFVSMTQHLDMVRAMSGSMQLPIVADIDTGYGNAINVTHVIAEYGRAGATAVVIDDKTFPKVSSLASTSGQELLRIEEFQGTIAAACLTARPQLPGYCSHRSINCGSRRGRGTQACGSLRVGWRRHDPHPLQAEDAG